MVAKFKVGGALSGRDDAMDEKQMKRFNDETPNSKDILVPCFSLNTIMKALDVQKIDFFSLDVEGGEYDVLKTIDFNHLDIETFVIEHNARKKSIKQYKNLFEKITFKDNPSARYLEIKVTSQDSFFVKNFV